MTAIALTIAGSDSGGGAGVQADLKTFSALGVYGASVITAVTAQNTQAVTAVHDIPAEVVKAQIEAVLSDLDVGAIKIGMLSSPQIIETVAQALDGRHIPIVLDPVMVAKSGDRLLQEAAVATLRERLLPMATLVTPNVPEATILAKTPDAETPDARRGQAEALLALGAQSVLMKGGHLDGDICADMLLAPGLPTKSLTAARVHTKNTHGTGCTYSAAIAAQLAKGHAVTEAVDAAHSYLQAAIQASDTLEVGSGHGPVHHFHGMPAWKR